MRQRLPFLLVAACLLIGTASCSKKEEKPKEEDLQMSAPAAVVLLGDSATQAV